MDWEGREESSNVEDRRGEGGGGTRTGLAIGGAGGVVVLLLALFLGIDPSKLGLGGGPGPDDNRPDTPRVESAAEKRHASFTKVVFKDTETIWKDLFGRMGKTYREPVLVLFTGHVDSACGSADSAVGPFYCPGDDRVYIDLSFYDDLQKQLNAPGEFARAYVIAHEVGHHVQRLLGYSQKVDKARTDGTSKRDQNKLSVRLELQADYLAGVWAHHARKKFGGKGREYIDAKDIDDAVNAAEKIGDDALQRKSSGRVRPDAFTHGTSAQRMRWFRKGYETGDVEGAAALFDVKYEDL